MSCIKSIRTEVILELLGELRDDPYTVLKQEDYKSLQEYNYACSYYNAGYEQGLNDMIEVIVDLVYEEEPRTS